jgi:hypothetical protein
MATSESLDPHVDEQTLQVRGSSYIAVAVDSTTSQVSQNEEIESSAESFLAELNKLEATNTLTLALCPKKKRKINEPNDEGKIERKDEEDGNNSGDSVYYSNSSQEETPYQKECAEIAKKFRTATGSLTLTGENRGRMSRLGKINESQSQPRSKSPSPETDVDLRTESSSDCTDVSWMLDTGMLELEETDLIFDSKGQISRAFHATELERVDEEVEGDGAEMTKLKLVRWSQEDIVWDPC